MLLYSETINLLKKICKNETITLLSRSDDISITNITESVIEFEKGFSRNQGFLNPTYKGIIVFVENEGTKISIEYKRGYLIVASIFMFLFASILTIFTIFSLLYSRPGLEIGLILPVILSVILPLRLIYNFNQDEGAFADNIFNFLFNVSEIYKKEIPPSKIFLCPICNREISIDSKKCKYCFTEFNKCVICKRPIPLIESVFCPFCSGTFHKDEILEWLKVNANCPICKKEIDMWEFQKYLEIQNKLEVISSKLNHKIEELAPIICSNCQKYIPGNAQFCIFCGVKVIGDK